MRRRRWRKRGWKRSAALGKAETGRGTAQTRGGKPQRKLLIRASWTASKKKEKDVDKKKKEKGKEITSSSSNLKLLLEEKKSSASESNRMSHDKTASSKLKEEVLRTPEKDRRDRDRDSDRHRDRDRHKDRTQPGKVSKSKSAEVESDKGKPKSSPAPKDVRPKEKRLVNDDLMQTSFERMLSLKDQEIEQWHRKHMEKMKQKERERMKQRPGAETGKLKSKDRAKSSVGEACQSNQLLRSKSSEASEVQGREKALKDATSARSFSLDAKSLPHAAKLGLNLENSLSRSPRPESEKSGLISRSVSMVSVASSEDSCQAAALTPRPLAEYDSDFAPEGSDSQLSSSQSSFVIHPARSPAVHEKESEGLLEAAHRSKTSLPVRHMSPYLRSILDEDAKAVSADSRTSEDPGRVCTTVHSSGEHPKSPLPDSSVAPAQEGFISHGLASASHSNSNPDSENLASSGAEGNISGTLLPVTSNSSDPLSKDLTINEINSQQAVLSDGRQQSTPELKRPSTNDPPTEKNVSWPVGEDCRMETSNEKASTEHNDKDPEDASEKMLSSVIHSNQKLSVNSKESTEACRELLQRDDAEQKEKAGPSEGLTSTGETKEEELKKGSVWTSVPGNARAEWASSPGPSGASLGTSTQRTDRCMGDSAIIVNVGSTETRDTPEDMEVEEAGSKDTKDSTGPIDHPSDKYECGHPMPSPAAGTGCTGPEQKGEVIADAPEGQERSSSVEAPEIEGPLSWDVPQSLPAAEVKTEQAEKTPDQAGTEDKCKQEQQQQEVSAEAQGGHQGDLQAERSNTCSGSSSPLPMEGDALGAKAKTRPMEEEDITVHHPRKRKMPRVSQVGPSAQQAKDKTQQSLAAIVDSLKLEEIQPYQTERANPYYEFLHIRKKIEEKRKVLCSVIPQAPQYYDEYVTFNGSYLLDGNPLSKLCIPTITPPPSLPDPLKEMFKQQEVVRMKLRLQHSIEREKLIVSNEQEVLRVHYRAARTLANQTLPFSACTVLLDAEVYNMPQDAQGEDGKTSVRDRFNARQFMSWLQDVDDKFDKLKTCLLMRQQHEAAALNAVQRLEWQLKLQELDPATYKSTSIFEIPEFYIPLVDVNDDFDLTPI
ncbi:hypothetical protein AGOR_G00041980 [Albula goreensis]|uniref:Ankyrin repeat domain-containing protein 12 n=1 Tax=Albula goreensis TaxID=1534307 RepID=A0A8T3E2F5_9TELE|nr:hypothetical protein AGOR_G00041980 [Albula goreensis]